MEEWRIGFWAGILKFYMNGVGVASGWRRLCLTLYHSPPEVVCVKGPVALAVAVNGPSAVPVVVNARNCSVPPMMVAVVGFEMTKSRPETETTVEPVSMPVPITVCPTCTYAADTRVTSVWALG